MFLNQSKVKSMLTRRNFMKSGLAAGLATTLPVTSLAKTQAPKTLIKPPALNKGDTVGLITPASALFEANRTIQTAVEKIEALGYKTKLGKNISKKYGYLAGTIEERVSDIHNMFEDDDVNALVTIRGGYGSGQLLDYLNYQLIKDNPKILVGYSDVTSLLNGIHAKTGLVTFHGPVAISTFTDFTKKYFYKILGESSASGEIEDAPFESNLQTSNRIWSYRKGSAEGRLIGGNMTLMQALLGTPYEFDSDGAILFFEEVGEEPYDIDRILWQFKMAGKFDKCRAVIFDKMPDVQPASYRPAFNNSLSIEEIVNDIFKEYDFPVCLGFSLGHIKHKPTLPLGVRAKLDADHGKLHLLEGAVI